MIRVTLESDCTIEELSENKFHVNWEKNRQLTVKKRVRVCVCNEYVNLHCRYCRCCPYEYTCNCQDSPPGVCCVHTHFLAEYLNGIDHDNDDVEQEDVGMHNTEPFEQIESGEGNQWETLFDDEVLKEETTSATTKIEGEDTKRRNEIKLGQLRQTLDELEECAKKCSTSSIETERIVFDKICEDIGNIMNVVRQGAPDLVRKLAPNADVARNPRIRDATMRNKIGLPVKKKKKKDDEPATDYFEFDANDIVFCMICRKVEPDGTESSIEWKACVSCKLWVHTKCAMKNNLICGICSTEFVDRETL
ncbi:unnamed protein product [Caenorhabditis nigoni]